MTAESHRDRIERAEAIGDHETAQHLLLHPAGVHIGPTASAIERGGPGRPGQPTERGELARARAAEAARLRAHLESVERELKDHEHAAVTAARDAGVDEDLIATAQSGDPDEVIALDNATETRRQGIRAAALTAGFDNEAIDRIRREAEPERPELGWGAVVEATAERCERKDAAESAARNVGLDVDAIDANARKRDAARVEFLERAAEIVAAAREVGFDDKEITRILFAAESRKAGSGLTAVVGATAERRQRLDAEESAARIGDLDVDAVRSSVWKRDAVPRGFLGATTKRAEKIVAKARAASLDDEEIVRIRKESELMVAGSGWGAVVEATAKQEAAIVKAAWEVFHDVEEIARVHDASELKRSGSGWEAVVEVTAERRKRKDAAESSARDAGLDVEAVYENAVTRDVDPIDYLERATAKREEEIEAAARALLLDDEEITRIRDASALQEAGSGWGGWSRRPRSAASGKMLRNRRPATLASTSKPSTRTP